MGGKLSFPGLGKEDRNGAGSVRSALKLAGCKVDNSSNAAQAHSVPVALGKAFVRSETKKDFPRRTALFVKRTLAADKSLQALLRTCLVRMSSHSGYFAERFDPRRSKLRLILRISG